MRGGGKLRARDLARGRFFAEGRRYQLDDDKLSLWPRSRT